MGLTVAGTGGEKAPVGSLPEPTFLAKKKAEDKQEWPVVGRARGKLQDAGSQFSEASKNNDTNCPTPKGKTPASHAEKNLHHQFNTYERL